MPLSGKKTADFDPHIHNKMRSSFLCAVLSCAAAVSAHGAMTAGFGDFSVSKAKALGIVDSTPRDGSTRTPFQTDTSIIRDRDMATAGVCGKTIAGGPNNVEAGMAEAQSVSLLMCLPQTQGLDI